MPQVYYNGLLAGQNTPEEVQTTGDRRAINRHNYTLAEVEAAAQKPVVQRLARLVELRSRHPAFQGKFQSSGSDRRLALAWQAGDWRIRLALDLENLNLQIFTTAAGEREQEWII